MTIINQTMANHYFPDGQAIGKHLNFTGDKTPYEIIGISSDAKYYEPGERSWRTMYINRYQTTTFTPGFVLASSASVPSLEGEIQRAIGKIAPDAKVSPITALSDQVDASPPKRLNMTMRENVRSIALSYQPFGVLSWLVLDIT
jgi:hypothetical protein